jgi:hypothetical protein
MPPFVNPFDDNVSSHIVENADNYRYHTLLNITISKRYDLVRSDSQASGLLGDIEIHFHHPSKGGLPASIIEEALAYVDKALNGGIGKS